MDGGAKPPNDTVYADWTYEQIMNGVFGTAVPDRVDVENEPWLNFTNGSDTNTNRIVLFWANDNGAKINVYYSDQVTGTTADNNNVTRLGSSKWLDWVDIPNVALADAAFNSRYEHVPFFNPKTFYDVADAFASARNELSSIAVDLTAKYTDLGDGNNSFKGNAAGAFRDLLGNVRDAVQDFADQMGVKAVIPYDTVMQNTGLAARNFLVEMWNAYIGWRNSDLAYPWQAVWNLVKPLISTWQDNNGKGVSHTGIRYFHNTSYGDLSTPGAWMAIEAKAKQNWIDNVIAKLDGPARTAVTNLTTAYNSAVNTLNPLTLPAMTPIQPNPTDPNAGLNNSINDLNKNLNNGLNNVGKGLNDVGNNMSNGLNKVSNGLGKGINSLGTHMGSSLSNVGNGLGKGIHNLATGMGTGINGIGAGLNALGTGIGTGIHGLGTGLNDIGHGLGTGINGLGNGLNGLGLGLGAGIYGLGAGISGISGIGGGKNGKDSKLGESQLNGGSMSVPPLSPTPDSSFTGLTGGTGDLKTPAQAGMPGAGANGLTGGESTSSGKFVAPGADGLAGGMGQGAGGAGGIPMYPPMMGGGMGMGGGPQQGQQERERTTWLAEEEEVWGTDPVCGPGVIGRGEVEDEEEAAFGGESEEAQRGRGRRRSH